jgi:AbrB family looped-hinge helix DNA binding protein
MESSVMTTKGQIVIPKGIREKYRLEPGTKIFFEETPFGISLKQLDANFIRNAKGMVPKKKGEKTMKEWWPEYKAEEIILEERKLDLLSEPEIFYKRATKIKRKK